MGPSGVGNGDDGWWRLFPLPAPTEGIKAQDPSEKNPSAIRFLDFVVIDNHVIKTIILFNLSLELSRANLPCGLQWLKTSTTIDDETVADDELSYRRGGME